eukprot:scaffold964_cov170-Amphora_coffeaeformis.AAC.5
MVQEAGACLTKDNKGFFKGLACEVARRWKNISKVEKEHLQQLSDMDKARHAREMENWIRQNEAYEVARGIGPLPMSTEPFDTTISVSSPSSFDDNMTPVRWFA